MSAIKSAITETSTAALNFATSKFGVSLISTSLAAYFTYQYFKTRVQFIALDEQLFLETTTDVQVINGPKTFLLPPVYKSFQIKKVQALKEDQFAYIFNSLSGKTRTVIGPQILHLQPYDQILKTSTKIALKSNEYLRLYDSATGKCRTLTGEAKDIIPLHTEEFVDSGKKQGINLKKNEYVFIQNKETSEIRVVTGQHVQKVQLDNYEQFINVGTYSPVHTAYNLNKKQYLTVEDTSNGGITTFRGPGIYFPSVYDKIKSGVQEAINLSLSNYIKVKNLQTGSIRTEKGEKLFFPGEFDEVLTGIKKAVNVDEVTSVLVRNNQTGQLSLKTEKQLYFPENDEEIEEIRSLITLAEYQACVVKNQSGEYQVYSGKNKAERSFFLQPYNELVQLCWSRGRRRETRDLKIKKIDCRPQFMSFEFNCRTSDNVELILEGTLFWEIFNAELMVKNTGDTSGDICSHARSQFIQAVSNVDLKTFMSNFNKIAESAHQENDSFYQNRGCQIHSLEVTGYRCAEQSTAKILEQIIQETTNRMNRMQQQESANEVRLYEIKGEINEEKAAAELLKIKTENNMKKAANSGLEESNKIKEFLNNLEEKIPDLETRLECWKILRSHDNIDSLSHSDCKMIFTPNDVELKVEAK